MYFLGFLLGGWLYVRWCSARDRRIESFLQRATADERAESAAVRRASREKSGWLEAVPDLLGWADDPVSAFLGFLALLLAVVVAAALAAWAPVVAVDALAGYLAEIVLEFVIGASIYRHVKKPRPLDAYWGFMVQRTWLAGALAVVLAGAAGYAVQRLVPDARTLGEALHALR